MRSYCRGRVEVIAPKPPRVNIVVVAGVVLILVGVVIFEIQPEAPGWCIAPLIVGSAILVIRFMSREKCEEK